MLEYRVSKGSRMTLSNYTPLFIHRHLLVANKLYLYAVLVFRPQLKHALVVCQGDIPDIMQVPQQNVPSLVHVRLQPQTSQQPLRSTTLAKQALIIAAPAPYGGAKVAIILSTLNSVYLLRSSAQISIPNSQSSPVSEHKSGNQAAYRMRARS
eukprot:scaffold216991_cov18-Prasinocladus_malaysianus.AAC.1